MFKHTDLRPQKLGLLLQMVPFFHFLCKVSGQQMADTPCKEHIDSYFYMYLPIISQNSMFQNHIIVVQSTTFSYNQILENQLFKNSCFLYPWYYQILNTCTPLLFPAFLCLLLFIYFPKVLILYTSIEKPCYA